MPGSTPNLDDKPAPPSREAEIAALPRYDLITNYRAGCAIEEMERSEDGEWLRYESVAPLLAQLQQARQELAQSEHDHIEDLARARNQRDEAEAALQQAREALKQYGVHKGCRKTSILSPSTKCSCGFEAALKAGR